jgi:hypothetical protein
MAGSKHSFAVNQSAADTNTTAAAQAPSHHPGVKNYTGFIIVTLVIVFGVGLWVMHTLGIKREARKREEKEAEHKQKAEKMADEWLKRPGGESVARPEKALDIEQINKISYEDGCKTPSAHEANSVYLVIDHSPRAFQEVQHLFPLAIDPPTTNPKDGEFKLVGWILHD